MTQAEQFESTHELRYPYKWSEYKNESFPFEKEHGPGNWEYWLKHTTPDGIMFNCYWHEMPVEHEYCVHIEFPDGSSIGHGGNNF